MMERGVSAHGAKEVRPPERFTATQLGGVEELRQLTDPSPIRGEVGRPPAALAAVLACPRSCVRLDGCLLAAAIHRTHVHVLFCAPSRIPPAPSRLPAALSPIPMCLLLSDALPVSRVGRARCRENK